MNRDRQIYTMNVFLGVFLIAVIFSGFNDGLTAEPSSIPISGDVCHVIWPGGTHKICFTIAVDKNFSGKLPDEVDSISITGPQGLLPVKKNDFNYNPQKKLFWTIQSGIPAIGDYRFHLTVKNASGTSKDTQAGIRDIPVPGNSGLRPRSDGPYTCKTPEFSWPLIPWDTPLYYQIQIRDFSRTEVYHTGFIKDLSSIRIPPDTLIPGESYQWRIRVADNPDWVSMNNRSQTRWLNLDMADRRKPCDCHYTVPPDTNGDWAVSSLKREGIDEKRIMEMMNLISDDEMSDIHSVLIVKNGKLVLEEYFHGYARQQTHSLMSVSKSITSLLIGIAMDQKKISGTEKHISDFFLSHEAISWNDSKKTIQLKHVLNMTAGLDWNYWLYSDTDPRSTSQAMIRSNDWIDFVLERELVDTPGKKFVYSNGLTMLLGEILKNATGEYADKFAGKYLFNPLGISDYTWQKLPDGTVITAWGLKLKPCDMAKIGYTMLQGGKWKDHQIVSSSWVKESTQRQSQGDNLLGSGYGYQWWLGSTLINGKSIELFYAAGKGGQYVFVCPELDLVTVFTSKPEAHPLGEVNPQILMANYIIPAMVPSEPPRKIVKLDSTALDIYAGDYRYQRLKMPLTIFRKDGNLLFRTDKETGLLSAESTSIFYGTSKQVGDFRLEFIKEKNGQINQFLVRIGFGTWAFEKIK